MQEDHWQVRGHSKLQSEFKFDLSNLSQEKKKKKSPTSRCSSFPPLTQHQDHLAAQTVVDMEGLLAVIIFLAIPGVRADHRPGNDFRHSSGGEAS